MKKTTIFGLLTVMGVGFMACNSSSDETSTTDTTTSSEVTTTNVSSSNYAAKADSFRVNSEAGNYLDARTGKPIKISVDTTTGTVTNENGQTVRHYVDKRTWWVYDVNSGDTVGSAKMQKGKPMYQDNNGKWMTYDERWKDTDSMDSNSSMNNSMNNENPEDLKIKAGDHKLKVDDGEVKTK